MWSRSCFATLTYADGGLPTNGSLDKSEFTKYWKRLRKELEPRKIRYYGCGEYGERGGRPHYHALIFGVAPTERVLVERAWGHGHVMLGTVTMASARYVADYVGKAVTGERGRRLYGDRTPPFAVMSQGVGRRFVLQNRDQLLRLGVVTVGGKPMGMPRYYRDLLEKEVKLLDDLWVSEEVHRDEDQEAYWYRYWTREQRERNLVARQKGIKGVM